MRYKILLYGLMAAAISSCSSAYKASQTPDDVYFSPAREGVQKQTAKKDRYEEYIAAEDDQYLRMKIRDRQRWAGIDDYSYWNDSRYIPSYNYNYNYYRNNPYSPYAWNNWNMSPYSSFYYSPYYGSGLGIGYSTGLFYPHYGYGYGMGYNPYGPTYIVKYPTRTASPSVNRPNLSGYRNGLYNNNNRNYNNQGSGNTLKRVFAPNQNARMYDNNNSSYNNNNSNNSVQRSYSPSSSGGSSGGSSGSSSGMSRPPR
jgi:hypothetical protein